MEPSGPIQSMESLIRGKALELGFADCGFSGAGPLTEDRLRLSWWLKKGFHARMGFMENHFEKRTDPTLLVEGARSVISLLMNYYPDRNQTDPRAPVLSKYAYGTDYHYVMKEKMHRLFDFIRESFGHVEGRVFVDSAPVLDRAWARRAGLGWIGKNSLLISRKFGSFVFIGELITDLDLGSARAVPEGDFCGSCNRCIEACPTHAILDNRTIDSQKCISYQTIENRGAVDPEVRERLSNRVFGCDICQDVCPWNRNPEPHSEPEFEPSPDLLEMTADEWRSLDKERYRKLFRRSAVERAGFKKVTETMQYLRPEENSDPS